jgi:hypothetical protein
MWRLGMRLYRLMDVVVAFAVIVMREVGSVYV